MFEYSEAFLHYENNSRDSMYINKTITNMAKIYHTLCNKLKETKKYIFMIGPVEPIVGLEGLPLTPGQVVDA